MQVSKIFTIDVHLYHNAFLIHHIAIFIFLIARAFRLIVFHRLGTAQSRNFSEKNDHVWLWFGEHGFDEDLGWVRIVGWSIALATGITAAFHPFNQSVYASMYGFCTIDPKWTFAFFDAVVFIHLGIMMPLIIYLSRGIHVSSF